MTSHRAGRFGALLALGAGLAALACAPRIHVTTYPEPDADLSAYESFALVPPPDARTAVREVLEAEVAEEFVVRGYRAAELQDSDLIVIVQGRTQQAQRRVFAESPGGCCTTEEYLAGTLVISVFDARTRQRLWRGVGEVNLYEESDEAFRSAASRAAAAILKELPDHR